MLDLCVDLMCRGCVNGLSALSRSSSFVLVERIALTFGISAVCMCRDSKYTTLPLESSPILQISLWWWWRLSS